MRKHRAAGEKPLHWVRKAIYLLHAFQKKSPSGVRTARRDVELIEDRLRSAREDYEERYGKETK